MLSRLLLSMVSGGVIFWYSHATAQAPAPSPTTPAAQPREPIPKISAALNRFPVKAGRYEITSFWGQNLQRREGSREERQSVSGCMSDNEIRARWSRELTISPTFSRCTQHDIVVGDASVSFNLSCPGTTGKLAVTRIELSATSNGFRVTSRFLNYVPNDQINNEYEMVGTWKGPC